MDLDRPIVSDSQNEYFGCGALTSNHSLSPVHR